jgi:hypothetical protein
VGQQTVFGTPVIVLRLPSLSTARIWSWENASSCIPFLWGSFKPLILQSSSKRRLQTMPTTPSKPPLEPKAVGPDRELTTTTSARASSSCLRFAIDAGLLVVFPCEPMARASSWVGINYTIVFCLVALLYGGGIACFGAAAAVSRPLFEVSIGYAVLVGWVLNMMGAVASGTSVWLAWEFVSIDFDEDPSTTFDPSTKSMTLVVVHLCSQAALLGLLAYLRREVLTGANASSCCSPGFGSFCFTVCLPSCSFAEAAQQARSALDKENRQVEKDELPAFVA